MSKDASQSFRAVYTIQEVAPPPLSPSPSVPPPNLYIARQEEARQEEVIQVDAAVVRIESTSSSHDSYEEPTNFCCGYLHVMCNMLGYMCCPDDCCWN